mmetsp:Transcript_19624/g.30247  ORF Transcript_19624/g.30247 Transcript_19624/m.30247 type:complete len:111 (+) Transcript_19624:2307-2639(+)
MSSHNFTKSNALLSPQLTSHAKLMPNKNVPLNLHGNRRDHGLLVASRENIKKQYTYLKVWEEYERVSKEMEDIARRRDLLEEIATLREQVHNYDQKFDYDLMMNKTVDDL